MPLIILGTYIILWYLPCSCAVYYYEITCKYCVYLLHRRGTGAFNKSKTDNPSGAQMKDGSVKYSLRDTEKRVRRQRNQTQGTHDIFGVCTLLYVGIS